MSPAPRIPRFQTPEAKYLSPRFPTLNIANHFARSESAYLSGRAAGPVTPKLPGPCNQNPGFSRNVSSRRESLGTISGAWRRCLRRNDRAPPTSTAPAPSRKEGSAQTTSLHSQEAKRRLYLTRRNDLCATEERRDWWRRLDRGKIFDRNSRRFSNDL